MTIGLASGPVERVDPQARRCGGAASGVRRGHRHGAAPAGPFSCPTWTACSRRTRHPQSRGRKLGTLDRIQVDLERVVRAIVSPLIADARDIYGRGVNLTALRHWPVRRRSWYRPRCATSWFQGSMRTSKILGECYLKHVTHPVRAFRLGAPGERTLIEADAPDGDLKATVPVIPFLERGVTAGQSILGQALADDVITALSRSREINVVSWLSSGSFAVATRDPRPPRAIMRKIMN